MTQLTDGERAVRRAHIEGVLAYYPNVEPAQLEELLRWFRKEASALDVALLTNNPAVIEPYRRFRADHNLDGLSRRDLAFGLSMALSLAAIVAVIVWLSF